MPKVVPQTADALRKLIEGAKPDRPVVMTAFTNTANGVSAEISVGLRAMRADYDDRQLDIDLLYQKTPTYVTKAVEKAAGKQRFK